MSPIAVTPSAWNQIEKLATGKFGLKIGLKKGGCAGMEYAMEIVDEAGTHDLVIQGDKTNVVIAANAQMFLFGLAVDYETSLLESGFKFTNPNVTESCGCGESISFSVDHA